MLNNYAIASSAVCGLIGIILGFNRIAYAAIAESVSASTCTQVAMTLLVDVLACTALGCTMRSPVNPGKYEDEIHDVAGVQALKDECEDNGGDPEYDCDYSAPGLWIALCVFLGIQIAWSSLIAGSNLMKAYIQSVKRAAGKGQPTGAGVSMPGNTQYSHAASNPHPQAHVHFGNAPAGTTYPPQFMYAGQPGQPGQPGQTGQPMPQAAPYAAYAGQPPAGYGFQQPATGIPVQPGAPVYEDAPPGYYNHHGAPNAPIYAQPLDAAFRKQR